ncbi:hypothetical protein Moror_12008 [Moniliophthora roreri MCA 2997]|uniref:Uncharacterized protein n=1 Tax=Moniliophthora roreri (strain MCA 2997) TaxID=1381753 RepID=V2WJH9_MONRO|nr:hypothetical protein Moror_12008 [Moniliophthora roreri MCA 2997]
MNVKTFSHGLDHLRLQDLVPLLPLNEDAYVQMDTPLGSGQKEGESDRKTVQDESAADGRNLEDEFRR